MIREALRRLSKALGYLLYFIVGVQVARIAWVMGGPPAMILALLALASLPFYWRYLVAWLKSIW